ncbi:hypothetical protein ACFQZI_07190 [Mucilaginibacter lutimaris]|uniref:Uncharacterized protein n=1 Tax=Mucilaginibacter lutimaris TaxID=931629 RepID=A0ABW2ZEK8_9SPHI
MTEHKNKLFPFAWVLLVIVIMAFVAYFLYVNRFKGNKTIDLSAQQTDLINRHENDTTVTDFISYVSDGSNKMSLDHEYSNTALIKLSRAVSAMARATDYVVKANLNEAETDADKITRDPLAITHADNIRKAADILIEALNNLQKAKYPTLAAEVAAVSEAAQQIDPDVMTLDQKSKVKQFFQRSAELLSKMN